MFEPKIKDEPTQEKRRIAIRAVLMDMLEAKRFHLTPLLMEDEPWRTHGLEALDGVSVESGRPVYVEHLNLLPQCPPIRLIAITNDGSSPVFNPKGQIVVRSKRPQRIPGTSHTRTIDVEEKKGPDATLSHTVARALLVRSGWPIKDEKSKGNTRGSLVEWDWLCAEAKLPNATPAVIALYESIRDGLKSVTPKSNANKADEARP